MNRTILGCLVAVLAVPSAATAAPLNELPFEQRPGVAGCLHATGSPGGLSVLGAYSRRDSSTDLVTAGAGRTARVSIGRLFDCAAVAEAPGGAAIVAGTAVSRTYDAELRVALREPGGAFGVPVRLDDRFSYPAVAIAPSGAALVAWVTGEPPEGDTADRRLVVARRAPGAAFGPPETVVEWRQEVSGDFEVRAAIDAGGAATVLLRRYLQGETGGNRIDVATAAQGAPFSLQRLGGRASGDADPDLAVAPDGWTLVVYRSRGEEELPKVFERAPGAASFTAVTLPAALPADESRGWSFGEPAVAVRDGGGAVVAWRTGPFESMSGVDAVTREAAGAFTARRVAEPVRKIDVLSGFGDDFLDVLDPFDAPPVGYDDSGLKAALAPDGRLVLAWPAPAGERPLVAITARAAIGRLDGGFEPARTLGSPLRETGDVAPLFTADGRAAVAWTDNADPPVRGRLHVAVEGAPATTLPRPQVVVRASVLQRLYPSEPVRALVNCKQICDLRATAIGRRAAEVATSTTRRPPGTHRIAVGPVSGLRPGTRQMVRIVVHAAAPGGQETTVRSLRIPVIGLRSLPLRTPRAVVARRDGDSIVVTWRTAKPARRQIFILIGAGPDPEEGLASAGAYAVIDGAGRQRFRARLRPAEPGRVRAMTVLVESYDSGEDGPLKTVRVR